MLLNYLKFKSPAWNHFPPRIITQTRSLTIQTALRPFFFLVHPDLFGNYPQEREVNENSLQILSAYLESLEKGYLPRTKQPSLSFYLRNKGSNKDKSKPFKLVSVPLNQQRDSKTFVVNILKICDLPRDDVENVQTLKPRSPKKHANQSSSEFTYAASGRKYNVDDKDDQFSEEFDLFQFKIRRAREDETLEKFVKKNIDLAEIRMKGLEDLKEEVNKLKVELEKKLDLVEICYKCGWNIEHFRGCLKSLEKLHELYTSDMGNLKNKKIIFSQFTGVSPDGEIHLFTGDVQNNWLDVSEYSDNFL